MTHEVKSLALIFDSEERNGYCPGELVSGRVLLELSASIKVKAVKILAKGFARVCWSDKLSRCSEEKETLSLSSTLLQATGSEELILDPGTHEIHFELQLPQTPLVSSFSGKYGSVFYIVHAVLQRSLHENQRVWRELPIISHIDVNMPALIPPVSQTREKMIGRWVFTSGPISLTVNIDRKGYCNGESIPIFAEIENCSSRLVVPKAAIYQIQTYMANGKTRIFKQEVASVRGNLIACNSSDRWNGKTLKIPPVSPSILNSDILRVEYLLAVIVQIPGAKNLKVELPVVIGTIPYIGLGSRTFSVSSHSSVDMGLLSLTLPDIAEAPPNYADVVSEEEFEEHRTSTHQSQPDWMLDGVGFGCIEQFRFQPPPPYSEVDPHPVQH